MSRTSSVALFAALLLSACAGKPTVTIGPDPGDPAAAVPAAPYTSVTAGTTVYRPVEPKPWVEQNERVAPKPKTGE